MASTGATSQAIRFGQEKLAKFGMDPRFWEIAKKEELQTLFLEFVDQVICDGEKVVVRLKV